MRIRWTVPAAEDLEGIKDYLNQHYPHFAEPTVRTIYQRIRSLKTAPNRGRPGHRSGTRELPLSPLPYVVVYAMSRGTPIDLTGFSTDMAYNLDFNGMPKGTGSGVIFRGAYAGEGTNPGWQLQLGIKPSAICATHTFPRNAPENWGSSPPRDSVEGASLMAPARFVWTAAT
ncbi:MAG: hypothetical protein DMG57_09190 [Acidobacteria bacterium]|nr:MAG: hypothetical protein DMG57_09190 [Acidobacteriota bacterium]